MPTTAIIWRMKPSVAMRTPIAITAVGALVSTTESLATLEAGSILIPFLLAGSINIRCFIKHLGGGRFQKKDLIYFYILN